MIIREQAYGPDATPISGYWYAQCDDCGGTTNLGDSHTATVVAAKRLGWDWSDNAGEKSLQCPPCATEPRSELP